MAADIDQKLLQCRMLEKLKLNSKKYLNVKESKDLIATFEQHIFVWHDSGSCILTMELSSNEAAEKMQKFTNANNLVCKPKEAIYKVFCFSLIVSELVCCRTNLKKRDSNSIHPFSE